jgi:hypothetical protein
MATVLAYRYLLQLFPVLKSMKIYFIKKKCENEIIKIQSKHNFCPSNHMNTTLLNNPDGFLCDVLIIHN